jgi:hypothetical protein
MTTWGWLIVSYIGAAVLTLVPTLHAVFAKVPLKEGGVSFEGSSFSADAKKRLMDHFSRLQGTLGFWKREAARNGRFHSYCLWWTIFSSSSMPFLTQAIDPSDHASRWFLTTVAAHVALLLGFHRGLKVAEHFKAFRHGESEFYDTYRRLLDRPEVFGRDETSQIKRYFEEVATIRKFVRNAETDSLPMLEDVRDQMSKSIDGRQP